MNLTPLKSLRISAIPLALVTVTAGALAIMPAAASAGSGGAGVVITPKIKQITCLRSCAAKRKIRAGSLISVKGEDLDVVKQVRFLGSTGKSDDTTAAVVSAKAGSLTVRVPADTTTGPLVAISGSGVRSRQSAPIAIRPLPPVIGTPELQPVSGTAPGVSLETGTSTPRVVFLGAKQLVRFSLRVNGVADAAAAVTLLRQSNGQPVASWSVAAPQGKVVSVDWNGLIAGKPAAAGRYAFSVAINAGAGLLASSSGATAEASANEPRDAFDLYGFMFPIRGRHAYSTSAGRFGAERGGRGHQGQDILANCGLKLVAARGGIVVQSRFQSAAGNFVVIRPDARGVGDQGYLHMATRAPFKPGDRVYTGQTIGTVGNTGRSSACHLHFEQWTGEIWRSKPIDPLPDLLAWDQVS